jgi:putative phage-type endonuclease
MVSEGGKMNRVTITPKNEQDWLELRKRDITSTESAALLGLSPYTTRFELYNQKMKGEKSNAYRNEAMLWGNLLQDTIANEYARREGWEIRRMDEYIRIEDLRIGSSFDYLAASGDILEIKNVSERSYAQGWTDGRAPGHIECQVQHQLLVSGRDVCYIGALVGGNRLAPLLKRGRNDELINDILRACSEFWTCVDQKNPPLPDLDKDYEAVIGTLQYAEPNKVIPMGSELEDLCAEYESFSKRAKEIDTARDKLKARILTLLGDAERADGKKFTLTAKMVAEAEVAYKRKAYRGFNVKSRKDAQ